MLVPSVTLDAALRDVDSDNDRYRFQAAVGLAPALLYDLGQPGPRWRACAEHDRGEAVLEALRRLLRDDQPANLRGNAAVGLGTLGEVEVLEHTEGWLDSTDDDEALAYLRESAMLAASYLGRAAIDAEADPEIVRRIRDRIERALTAEAPDLRFQAGTALVQLWGQSAEPQLVEALRSEDDFDVREGLVEAVSYLDPAGPEACALLEEIIEGEDGDLTIGFEAAMTLAAARRPSARNRLIESLPVRHQRDRALEALAALGGGTDEQIETIHQLARRLWVPGVTRVRAAYALARMVSPERQPNPGLTILRRLRYHPRAAVREAVHDAFKNLDTLAASD